jgi:hypothetical protein
MKMGEDTSFNEHINKLSVLAEELKIAGYAFWRNSLSNSWEQLKMSFCHSEHALNMLNLRRHLLLGEDRKLSLEKEINSHNSENYTLERKSTLETRKNGKRGMVKVIYDW